MSAFPSASAERDREARIDALLDELSQDEKVAMLSGHGFLEQIQADGGRYCARMYHIGAGNERLGIPPLRFGDGPRGVAMGASTCFPVPMARGATFDPALEERIGDAIGREMRAHGGNLFGGVCINLLRHPAWGRAQETYGEDPFLLGAMGVALVRGVQRHGVVATPKHFAANSMENARFTVDVTIDERALREVYLRHFERCIEAGAGAVMSAYNQVNGAYCGHNAALLTRILKEEWGFDGFVYSDFILGCRGWDAVNAGLDVEAPDTIHFGEKLAAAVLNGDVSMERIDDAVRRVLRSLFRVLALPDSETYGPESVACAKHVALAREAAQKSVVLLKNDGLLPFSAASSQHLLVLGTLADVENLGDHGSSRVYPPTVITPLAGLREGAPDGCEIVYYTGEDEGRVRALAIAADAVLVVAGYTHLDEGEFIPGDSVDPMGGDTAASHDEGRVDESTGGGDRADLELSEAQERLILTAAAANPNTAVALMAGSAVLMERWRHRVRGILMLWYPGMEGGAALADVVFGRVNPSGHLPFSIPARAEDLPFFDRLATSITYDLWHGYTHLEREGTTPVYPFGFGLSYTEFSFSDPSVTEIEGEDALRVRVEVANTGGLAGDAVLQIYAGWEAPSAEQPARRLCGFRRVGVAAGEAVTVDVTVALRDLASFDVESHCWRLAGTRWRIFAGASSCARDLGSVTVPLEERTWSVKRPTKSLENDSE